ncbi:MAG: HAD family phosphatase, partial [Clostridia bacterium]|nr:HAD family phosphatase [Clostridia bacterium]
MKLVATDLDSTLLRSDKNISDYTVEIFKECKKKGILVGFASSRAESAMTRFIKAIEPDFLISSGGATIRVGKNIIHESLISPESVKTILEMSRKFTGRKGLVTLDCVDGYYCNFIPTDPDRGATAKYSDFKDFDVPCYKITAVLEKDEWVSQILEECKDCFYVSYTGETWRKFASKGAE